MATSGQLGTLEGAGLARVLGSPGAEGLHEPAEGGHYPLIALPEQGREHVLADGFPPEVVPTVTSRVVPGNEVHPVRLGAASHVILSRGDSLRVERQAPLQAAQVHPAGSLEIDLRAHFSRLLPAV